MEARFDYHYRNAKRVVDFMHGPYVASNSSEFWEAIYPDEYDLFESHKNYPLVFLKKYLRFTNIFFDEIEGKSLFDHIIEAFIASSRYIFDSREACDNLGQLLDLLLTQGTVANFQQLAREWTTGVVANEKDILEDSIRGYRVRAYIIKYVEKKIFIDDQVKYMKSHPPVDWESIWDLPTTTSNLMGVLHYLYNEFDKLES
jgi:hypothetical protein